MAETHTPHKLLLISNFLLSFIIIHCILKRNIDFIVANEIQKQYWEQKKIKIEQLTLMNRLGTRTRNWFPQQITFLFSTKTKKKENW
jgi:hypothetical protein